MLGSPLELGYIVHRILRILSQWCVCVLINDAVDGEVMRLVGDSLLTNELDS